MPTGAAQANAAAFALPRCLSCQAPLPPHPQLNAFELLGFSPSFDLGLRSGSGSALRPSLKQRNEAVHEARRQRLHAIHPDRLMNEPVQIQQTALRWAIAINDAARTLQDPITRAIHLVALRDTSALPPCMTKLHWQRLYELKQALKELEGSDTHVERSRLIRLVMAEYEQGLLQLGAQIDAVEPPSAHELAPRIAYLRSLRNVVENFQR